MKEETATVVEQLHEAESEANALKTMTQRMILTHEEMVVLSINLELMKISETVLMSPNLQYFAFGCLFPGRSCSEEMLACSLLGFSFKLW